MNADLGLLVLRVVVGGVVMMHGLMKLGIVGKGGSVAGTGGWFQSIGLRPDQFSSMFAAGRVGGWTAHILEQRANNRLIRPASEYAGPRGLKYMPLDRRG